MTFPLYVVDAFTAEPYRGNPAAVVLLSAGAKPDDAWMQAVAAEMNLSETAFAQPTGEAGTWSLRWFTPTVEVDLCGHATLATAHVLQETGALEGTADFVTRVSGVLRAQHDGERIELDFPAITVEPTDPPAAFVAALGVEPVAAAATDGYLVLELASEADVRAVRPDQSQLEAAGRVITIVTARGQQADVVSRVFGPAFGIPEDPVTGAAHCALATYWPAKLGRDRWVGYQASARGGSVHVRREGDRVRLGGDAVIVTRGELLAD